MICVHVWRKAIWRSTFHCRREEDLYWSLCFREVKGVVYLISINTLEDAFINLVELRTPNIFHHQIREMWRNDCTPEVAQG